LWLGTSHLGSTGVSWAWAGRTGSTSLGAGTAGPTGTGVGDGTHCWRPGPAGWMGAGWVGAGARELTQSRSPTSPPCVLESLVPQSCIEPLDKREYLREGVQARGRVTGTQSRWSPLPPGAIWPSSSVPYRLPDPLSFGWAIAPGPSHSAPESPPTPIGRLGLALDDRKDDPRPGRLACWTRASRPSCRTLLVCSRWEVHKGSCAADQDLRPKRVARRADVRRAESTL
jgi:hypothetical protein